MSTTKDEKAAYAALHYEGTTVLKNSLGIRDFDSLHTAEARFIAANSHDRPTLKKFTLTELAHLLGDFYSYAGKIRPYTTGRGEASFARPEFVASYFESAITQALKKENYLRGTTREQFAARAAHFASEVNAVHPFIEGNGRMTRLFLKDLALQAGHQLDITRIEARKDEWYAGSKEAFETGNSSRLASLLLQAMPEKAIEVNQTPEESLKKAKETALEQAEKMCGKGIVKIADPGAAKPQHGKITSMEQHHVVMQTGANVLTIHARPPGQDVQVGKSIKIAYTNGKAQVVPSRTPARGPEKER